MKKGLTLTFPGFPPKILTTDALRRSTSGSATSCVAIVGYMYYYCRYVLGTIVFSYLCIYGDDEAVNIASVTRR
jgi:hypothetical protein